MCVVRRLTEPALSIDSNHVTPEFKTSLSNIGQ